MLMMIKFINILNQEHANSKGKNNTNEELILTYLSTKMKTFVD